MRLGERFEHALVYAQRLHAGQRRKGGEIPYVAHLLAVTALVLEHGGGEDEAIAALLHDAAEDQGGHATLAEIERRFGPSVAAIVAACSDSLDGTRQVPWQERKRRYLEHLRTAPAPVLLVAVCDKLHNAGSILADYRQLGESLWRRFNAGPEQILWYYDAVLETLRSAGAPPVAVERLERILRELAALRDRR